ncbi:hypothetical protein EPN96_09700 [bacterium]|nr:MAG: hypothetical protein EPN96_09700 [bacterium]
MANILDYGKAKQIFMVVAPVVTIAVIVPVFFITDKSPKSLAIYAALILLYLFPLLAAKKHIYSGMERPEKLLGSLIGLCVYGLFVIYHEGVFFLSRGEGEPGSLIYMPIMGVVFWVIIYWSIVLIFKKFKIF